MTDDVLGYLRAILAVPHYLEDHDLLVVDTYPVRGDAMMLDVITRDTGQLVGTYRLAIEEED